MSDGGALRPVCFMVMPFRKKKVTGPTGEGAPAEIDCDALWDKAYRPAIEEAGYTAIRADFEAGMVIVKDMLERLAFADLVVADMSLPNGNVYYEVGLRHVAKETGCILFAADWSRQLFDIEQFTSVRYPLKDGSVPDDEAEAIRATVAGAIGGLKDSRTPWHEFIHGAEDDQLRRGVFRDHVEKLSEFQASVRAARLTGDKEERQARIRALRDGLPPSALELTDVAIELLHLVRDHLGWAEPLEFADRLPPSLAKIPLVQEQRLLALANTGQPEEAIASLEELNRTYGETPERMGLIGGRYKRLWRAARDARMEAGEERASRAERRYLRNAIDHYTRGMELDYNEFYCSSNIAQLLLARGDEGDGERAVIVDPFVVAACERAIRRGEDDAWTRPTLLGAAFRAGDVAKARELADRIDEDGVVAWNLAATISDLKDAVARAAGTEGGPALADMCQDLEDLLAEVD
jgi:hypothetical protein